MKIKEVTILVVEDEFITLRHIKKTLQKMGYENVETAMNKAEATAILMSKEIHLALLDINLGDNNDGLLIAKMINEKIKIPFLYLTAYGTTEIIRKAIQTEPAAYLTKPFEQPDLLAAIELAIFKHHNAERENTAEKEYLLVKEKNHYIRLNYNDIVHIESDKNYLIVHTSDNQYSYRSTIKSILEMLPHDRFMQIHRSYIVAIKKIERFTRDVVIVSEGKEIPLSSRYREGLINLK